jgi:hypothetical protein
MITVSEEPRSQARQTRDRGDADTDRIEQRNQTQADQAEAALEGTEPLGADARNEASRRRAEQMTAAAGDGSLVRVRMLQQREDPRHDGQSWPPVGETFAVPAWEAEELTRLDEHHSHPLAVRADDDEPEDGWTQVQTHRRMGVEDRSDVPGLGEPPGTARHYADAEAAERAASAADAENDAEQRAVTDGMPAGGAVITDPTAPPPVGGETAGNDPDTPYAGSGKQTARKRQAAERQAEQDSEQQQAERQAEQDSEQQDSEQQQDSGGQQDSDQASISTDSGTVTATATASTGKRGRRGQAAAGRKVPDAETDSSGRSVNDGEENGE